MRQHEARIEFAVDVDHAVEMRFRQLQRIVAAVEELDLGTEQLGRPLRLVLAAGLDRFQRRALFFPRELAFAALAEGHADDLHAIALFRMQRDGAAGAPDEIARMGGDDETCFHGTNSPLSFVGIIGRPPRAGSQFIRP
jgi:hypothetical protein